MATHRRSVTRALRYGLSTLFALTTLCAVLSALYAYFGTPILRYLLLATLLLFAVFLAANVATLVAIFAIDNAVGPHKFWRFQFRLVHLFRLTLYCALLLGFIRVAGVVVVVATGVVLALLFGVLLSLLYMIAWTVWLLDRASPTAAQESPDTVRR